MRKLSVTAFTIGEKMMLEFKIILGKFAAHFIVLDFLYCHTGY